MNGQMNVVPRAESDVLLKELRLTFGDKEYTVPVLRMRQAAKWRQQFFERTQEISAAMIIENHMLLEQDKLNKAVGRSLMGALLQFPEQIPDLVFSYAPDLPKEEVMEAAYDQQFTRAFSQIWQVAFAPFLSSLGTVLEMQKSRAS